MTAVDRYAHSARTPADYRALAVEVERLSPRFNTLVAGEAARNLTFLALDSLDAHFDQPPAAQLEALALTVWSTALGEPPAAGEDAWTYSERLCAGQLSYFCKQIVPEHRALMLSQLVWSRFRERARIAMQECTECQCNPHYSDSISRFEQRGRAQRPRRRGRTPRASQHWPIAGAHASPWCGRRWSRCAATAPRRSKPAPRPGWKRASCRPPAGAMSSPRRARPATRSACGSAPAATSAACAAWARPRAAGFRQLAIQARAPEFPYELREYRVPLARRGTVPLRASP